MPTLKPLFTIIFGPTATGKSGRAYALADTLGADVLSFDSRHVYQGMDVVTGKDRPRSNWPHRLWGIDLVKPTADFSIRHFYEYAAPILADYRQRQQPLILVGGSWQYADVLLHPPATLLIPQDLTWRQQASQLSVAELQDTLQVAAPAKWSSLNASDRANPRRLIRAIEVARQPNPISAPPLLSPTETELQLQVLPLNQISENIAQRIEARLSQGALEETRWLIENYPDWRFPAFSATGYRLIRDHIEGRLTAPQLITAWLQQEREYAKRQLTWLRALQNTAH